MLDAEAGSPVTCSLVQIIMLIFLAILVVISILSPEKETKTVNWMEAVKAFYINHYLQYSYKVKSACLKKKATCGITFQ